MVQPSPRTLPGQRGFAQIRMGTEAVFDSASLRRRPHFMRQRPQRSRSPRRGDDSSSEDLALGLQLRPDGHLGFAERPRFNEGDNLRRFRRATTGTLTARFFAPAITLASSDSDVIRDMRVRPPRRSGRAEFCMKFQAMECVRRPCRYLHAWVVAGCRNPGTCKGCRHQAHAPGSELDIRCDHPRRGVVFLYAPLPSYVPPKPSARQTTGIRYDPTTGWGIPWPTILAHFTHLDGAIIQNLQETGIYATEDFYEVAVYAANPQDAVALIASAAGIPISDLHPPAGTPVPTRKHSILVCLFTIWQELHHARAVIRMPTPLMAFEERLSLDIRFKRLKGYSVPARLG